MAPRRLPRRPALARAALAALAGLAAAGCSGTTERPLTAGLFMPIGVARRPVLPATAPAADELADAQPAHALIDPAERSPKRAMILAPEPAQGFESVSALAPLQPAPTPADGAAPASVELPPAVLSSAALSPATADVPASPVPMPPTGPTPPATARPDAAPAVDIDVTGGYVTVGGVLARVNDTPIYAHRVLELVDRELAAAARQMGPAEFADFATARIGQQLGELVDDELEYSNALKSLTEEDRKRVLMIATEMRQENVRQAGGSLELARRRAAEDGYDFDELLRDSYRHLVRQVYDQAQVEPQIHVTADDMRAYYAANVAKRYGDKDRLQFRVVQVGQRGPDGARRSRYDALVKIRSVHDRAVAGGNFEAIARAENDDPTLQASGGDPGGWVDRGAYRFDAVEAALWALKPGGVTDVVEAEGRFFVAKLLDKHQGRPKPFEDPDVQADLRKQLEQDQRRAIHRRLREQAVDDAVITPVHPDLTVAVEMATQKYAVWNAAKR